VVGRSLEPREEALHRLVREFLVVGPAALLIAILGAYALAAAALRPVEAMRRRATAITASTPGQRLPVPAARDELSRLAVTLNDMLGRLEAAFEHERRFLDDASHELRTPLALLKTELEIALRHPRSRDELEQALASAAADTAELVQLAEDLLLVARAGQGELPIRTERLSARAILEEVAERFAGDAAARGRVVEVIAGTDAAFEADPARLKQALGNLVQNALVHGQGAIELDVRVRCDGVELHVLDAGPGFSDEFRSRAFDRFSRAEASRTSGGAGLGLAIVDLIARRHGAHAELRRREGGGADAVLVFRRSAQPIEPQPRRRSPAPQT
jgi:signal transduction histidine kinase